MAGLVQACPGHPRLGCTKDVDARPKTGHDGACRLIARRLTQFRRRVKKPCMLDERVTISHARDEISNAAQTPRLADRAVLRPLGWEVGRIAGAAVFLGSSAGNFMTGQTLVIDGGATIS